MPKYQIEFNRGGSLKSYKYFISEIGDNTEQLACDCANEAITKFSTLEKLPKSLLVREWDILKNEIKRSGHKFKLHLTFIQFTTDSGRKERKEWYQYNG